MLKYTISKAAAAILLLSAMTALSSCQGDLMKNDGISQKNREALLQDSLKTVKTERIFFGHQSVGNNIIQGIREIAENAGTEAPDFIEGKKAPVPGQNGFFHSGIGTNTKPLEKIQEFDSILRSGMAGQLDIAFMKLCYVDINADTDTEGLFAYYRDTMTSLRKDFPAVRFVHFTAPLTASNFKDGIKALLGRPSDSREGNIKREEYNAFIRQEYAGKEPVFDLAKFESPSLSGKQDQKAYKNQTYQRLRTEYTDDGGHLNKTGRGYISEALVLFLASVTAQPEIK